MPTCIQDRLTCITTCISAFVQAVLDPGSRVVECSTGLHAMGALCAALQGADTGVLLEAACMLIREDLTALRDWARARI